MKYSKHYVCSRSTAIHFFCRLIIVVFSCIMQLFHLCRQFRPLWMFIKFLKIFACTGVGPSSIFCLFQKSGSKNRYHILCEKQIKWAKAFLIVTLAYGDATLDRSIVYRRFEIYRADVTDEECDSRARQQQTKTLTNWRK